jgi:hypothetical protein
MESDCNQEAGARESFELPRDISIERGSFVQSHVATNDRWYGSKNSRRVIQLRPGSRLPQLGMTRCIQKSLNQADGKEGRGLEASSHGEHHQENNALEANDILPNFLAGGMDATEELPGRRVGRTVQWKDGSLQDRERKCERLVSGT